MNDPFLNFIQAILISTLIFISVSEIQDLLLYQLGKEVELNDLNQTEFFDISDFKIANDRIYIADRAKNRLFLFHEEGQLIHNTGREGRGLGEFIAGPKQITRFGDRIYVI